MLKLKSRLAWLQIYTQCPKFKKKNRQRKRIKVDLVSLYFLEKNNFFISVSHTTRKPRPNETNTKDYFFVTDEEFKRLIKNKDVYSTFDVDGLDSGIMPATGTPEPGCLFWDETLNILKIAAKNSNIVGADLNELSPIKGVNSYNFLAAKLVYKILSYKFLY